VRRFIFFYLVVSNYPSVHLKKQLLFFGFALLLSRMQAQIVNIPDANFKSTLIGLGVDTNGDGQIQVGEAKVVTNCYLPQLSQWDALC
jgi:hypothetical protein